MEHLEKIASKNSCELNQECVELIVKGFVEKLECFDNLVKDNSLEEIKYFNKDDPSGVLVITYSGSLLSIGPLKNGVRKSRYASIGIRRDVPKIATDDFSTLLSDISMDKSIHFKSGPINKTSCIYKLARVQNNLDLEKQETILSGATMVLVKEFIKVNNEY